jgi:hypothetical protein
LTLTIEEIQVIVKQLENESKALKHEIYKLAWFMRGALSFEEAYNLDQTDREIIAKIIEENLETSKLSGMPFF